MKKAIEEILEYLNDEEKHFWESCNCDEETKNYQVEPLCKCEENKNHIWRTIEKVRDWLNSPSCPLTDEEENY